MNGLGLSPGKQKYLGATLRPPGVLLQADGTRSNQDVRFNVNSTISDILRLAKPGRFEATQVRAAAASK